jgi:molybdate transport system ATP-binding protein
MSLAGRFDTRLGDFHLQAEFELPSNGICGIYGPSGCGKTSLLRAIAGLDRHSSGFLKLDEEIWQSEENFLPPHKRSVAYVFQESNLFEHLSVQANLEYGWRRIPAEQRKISLPRICELLDLGKLVKRRPDKLSGGERQRVAIGRALAVSPRLLLMDEPLASLDQQRRNEILPYLQTLHCEFDLPILYVSHDRSEISRLADHLLLMTAGRITASGNCQEMLTRLDLPLAHEETAASLLDAVVFAVDDHYQLTSVRCGEMELIVPGISLACGRAVRLLIASRDVSLALSKPSDSSILNVIPARIEAISAEDGASITVRLLAGEQVLLSRITRKSSDQLGLRPGMAVYAQVKSIALSAPDHPE